MDEELDDAHAVVGELALELVDLAVGALPGSLLQKPSMRSTSTRPYQVRSKIAQLPGAGSRFQKRQR